MLTAQISPSERRATDPVSTPLSMYMADEKPVGEAVVRKHGLQAVSYEQISSWPFADAILHLVEYDSITSTATARRTGLYDCIDTEEMFRTFFAKLRKERVNRHGNQIDPVGRHRY
jgi:hypothetical protein